MLESVATLSVSGPSAFVTARGSVIHSIVTAVCVLCCRPSVLAVLRSAPELDRCSLLRREHRACTVAQIPHTPTSTSRAI